MKSRAESFKIITVSFRKFCVKFELRKTVSEDISIGKSQASEIAQKVGALVIQPDNQSLIPLNAERRELTLPICSPISTCSSKYTPYLDPPKIKKIS